MQMARIKPVNPLSQMRSWMNDDCVFMLSFRRRWAFYRRHRADGRDKPSRRSSLRSRIPPSRGARVKVNGMIALTCGGQERHDLGHKGWIARLWGVCEPCEVRLVTN